MHVRIVGFPYCFVKASQDRYNKASVSVLYIANSIDAVKAVNEIYSIGKFMINTALKCFPINTVFSGAYADFVSKEKSIDKHEYILTNLISPTCEKLDMMGLHIILLRKKNM